MGRWGACISVCVGVIVIIWSALVLAGVRAVTIGTRIDWLAWGGVVLGVVLLAFGVWRIFGKKSRKR